jgi:hypothetical protein
MYNSGHCKLPGIHAFDMQTKFHTPITSASPLQFKMSGHICITMYVKAGTVHVIQSSNEDGDYLTNLKSFFQTF